MSRTLPTAFLAVTIGCVGSPCDGSWTPEPVPECEIVRASRFRRDGACLEPTFYVNLEPQIVAADEYSGGCVGERGGTEIYYARGRGYLGDGAYPTFRPCTEEERSLLSTATGPDGLFVSCPEP